MGWVGSKRGRRPHLLSQRRTSRIRPPCSTPRWASSRRQFTSIAWPITRVQLHRPRPIWFLQRRPLSPCDPGLHGPVRLPVCEESVRAQRRHGRPAPTAPCNAAPLRRQKRTRTLGAEARTFPILGTEREFRWPLGSRARSGGRQHAQDENISFSPRRPRSHSRWPTRSRTQLQRRQFFINVANKQPRLVARPLALGIPFSA